MDKPEACTDSDCHRRFLTGGWCRCGERHYGMLMGGYQAWVEQWDGNPPNHWIPSQEELDNHGDD